MPEVCDNGCSDWFYGCKTCACHKGELTRRCTKRMCFQFKPPKCARFSSSEGSEIEEPDDQETDPVDDKIKLEDEAKRSISDYMTDCMGKPDPSAPTCIASAKEIAEKKLGVNNLEDEDFEELLKNAADMKISEYEETCRQEKGSEGSICDGKAKELAAHVLGKASTDIDNVQYARMKGARR